YSGRGFRGGLVVVSLTGWSTFG
ncbi:hypothetical protein A2U01_0115400, partial [Trifolium medium]|nr:hypothetical protein [Trifolium medium]